MSSFVLGGTGPKNKKKKKKKKKYLVEKMLGTAYGIQRESKGLRGYRGRSILMLFFLHIHRMRRGKEDEEEEEEINMRESDTGARSDFLESPKRRRSRADLQRSLVKADAVINKNYTWHIVAVKSDLFLLLKRRETAVACS